MLKGLLSLFLQPNCLLCDRPSENELCYHCQQQLQAHQWPQPQQFWRESLPLFAWGEYEGILKRTITTLKYNQLPQLGEFLGICLGKSWLKSKVVPQKKQYIVTPIPLHPQRLKERGFNQAEIIARAFCRVTGYPLLPHGLTRIRDTEKLFDKNAQEREKIIYNSLKLGKDLQNKPIKSPILLIDDIYTTGATVREAVRVLRKHQLSVLGVAAIATPRQIK